MAVAYDAFSSGTAAGAGTYNVTHVTSGSNRRIYAATWQYTSGITYAGAALTNILSYAPPTPPGTNCPTLNVWSLANPAVGSNTLAVTTSNPDTVICSSYNGTDTTYNPLTSYFYTDTNNVQVVSSTIGWTTTVPNSWLISFVIHTGASKSMTAGAGTTMRGENVGTLSSFGLAAFDNNGAINPPALTNQTYNMASGSEFLTMSMWELPETLASTAGTMLIL